MDEYINREAAIAKCREIAACEWNHIASPVSWTDAYEQFAEDIEEIPAADVAPVRHGRWKDNKCTACGEEAFCYGERPYHLRTDFCPMCGAKMDLEG